MGKVDEAEENNGILLRGSHRGEDPGKLSIMEQYNKSLVPMQLDGETWTSNGETIVFF